MTDWGQLYRDHVDAITALAGGLTDDQLSLTVPGTPAWTVHDVLAHLAGGPADGVTGRMDGAPGPEWTARHVSERAVLPVTDLLEEMHTHQEGVAASVAGSPRPAVVYDIAVHHADLHEALGLGPVPERFWSPVVEAVAPQILSQAPATVRAGEGTYGAGGPRVQVAPYELFRALFSRRSRAQMRSWGAPALDDEQLAGLCVFGPRDDDQPVPG